MPDTLYKQVKRIAEQQEWSVTEVIRRGAETMTRLYPEDKALFKNDIDFPPVLKSRLRITNPDELKSLLRTDEERNL